MVVVVAVRGRRVEITAVAAVAELAVTLPLLRTAMRITHVNTAYIKRTVAKRREFAVAAAPTIKKKRRFFSAFLIVLVKNIFPLAILKK